MRSLCSTLCVLYALSCQLYAGTYLDGVDSTAGNKHEFSIEGAGYSSLPFTKREQGLPPTIQNTYDLAFRYWGFTIYPQKGFQLNLLYDYSFRSNLFLRSGIQASWTKSKMESDTATINSIQWSNWTSAFDPSIVSYESSVSTIAIPIEVGWILNKFMLVGGAAPLIIQHYSLVETNAFGEARSTEGSDLNNPFRGEVWQFDVDLNLKAYYLIENSLIDFQVFAGINSDWLFANYDVNTGVRIILDRKNSGSGVDD